MIGGHKVIQYHRKECCLISSLALDVTHKKRCLRVVSQSSHLTLSKGHRPHDPRHPFLTHRFGGLKGTPKLPVNQELHGSVELVRSSMSASAIQKQTQLQRQKRNHRFAGMDRVTPYQRFGVNQARPMVKLRSRRPIVIEHQSSGFLQSEQLLELHWTSVCDRPKVLPEGS
jgi:hypothetical protein